MLAGGDLPTIWRTWQPRARATRPLRYKASHARSLRRDHPEKPLALHALYESRPLRLQRAPQDLERVLKVQQDALHVKHSGKICAGCEQHVLLALSVLLRVIVAYARLVALAYRRTPPLTRYAGVTVGKVSEQLTAV